MRPAHVVEIETPKKFVLNGLWFGPKRPKRAIIWVHGMLSSAFSMRHVIDRVVDKNTAVLTFNNRGSESVIDIKRIVGKKREWIKAGTAHEVFTDSLDDLDGAFNLARKSGAKEIYLVGHSTGCQKSIYWLFKRKRKINGAILLGPLSDYAGSSTYPRMSKTLALAKKMIAKGTPHELLPTKSYWHYADAQRFLSLYTPDSVEQSIFPYFDENRRATILGAVNTPLMVVFASDDEYIDRPIREIGAWFEKNAKEKLLLLLTKKGGHSLRGAEIEVSNAIKSWIVKK